MTRKDFLNKCGVEEIYKNYTHAEALEAVKQYGYALQYVNIKFDREIRDITISEIQKILGFQIKVIEE